MVTWDDFDKIWASTSPLTPYDFSDPNYSQGWNFVGSTPPARQMWDSIQKKNDEKFKYLRDNFGTPNIVTQASQMTDTDKVYVYIGSEAGWNNGHWYYWDGSAWADGGVYNATAFVTDTTLSIAGQPADAKATGDALALKADLAGCTFTGNVSVNADFSVTGDSTLTGNVSASGDIVVVGDVSSANMTTSADATIGGALSVAGASTLTGNVSAGADITVVGDVSSANIIASNNANIGGNATVTGSVASASLTTTADGTIGGNLSVSGTTALTGTSTAPTPSADDNSTKIATTEYVQTEIKPIETDVTINDKRISNIEKLLQGHLYDYQTDNTSAYIKSVPAGAMPYAGLEKVGGKTVAWNQLVNTGTTSVATISGHKYYTLINGTASIVTADGTAITIVDDTADMVCDLTLMFGSGNEPSTTADFTAIFGATHYSYNAGTLLSAGVTEVVSSGANLIPTYTTSGSANGLTWTVSEDGSITINGTATEGTPIFAPISSWQWDGRTPCWLSGCPNGGSKNSYFLEIYGEDEWGSYQLSNEDTGNGVALQSKLSLDITNKPLRFRIVIISGTQCNNLTFKPILNYGTSAATYAPYIGTISTYSIPASIQALEGYGWSAGSVYNYLDFERKVFVKNVGSLTIDGSLAYNRCVALSDGTGYYVAVSGFFPVTPTQNNTLLSNRIFKSSGLWEDMTYGEWMTYSSNWLILTVPPSCSTVELAKTYLNNSPITAYQELATPIETDISQYITDDNLINVEAGGTLTFPNSNGTGYQIPVPSEEEYMIDLQASL